ncbi:MAG: tetratricopeptide repeat protein [Thermoanaerobaculia bacterium]|nr:tetratricopeptide repeat protein [Thermoanaerobaculia bacterium]
MFRIALVSLSLLIATTATAQQFVGPPVDSSRIVVTKEIAYRELGGQTLTFDLYRPAGDAVVAVAITCNIGIRGMKDWPGYVGWGKATAAAGMAAVHYDALGNDAIANFDALMETLRSKAAELRIDPTRVVLWAGSANVQLGLPLAMDAKRGYLRGAVIYYGDAPVTTIRADFPVFFVRAGLDQKALNDRIDTLLGRVLTANAPWTIENYGGGLHGFDIFNDNDLSREIIARTLSFMTRVTEPGLARAYVEASVEAELVGALNSGQWQKAIDGYGARVAANANDADAHLKYGYALYGAGRYDDALRELEAAWSGGRKGPRDTALPAARAAAQKADLDRAIHWLDICFSTPFVTPADVRADAAFTSILANPRIVALLAETEEQNAIIATLESGETVAGMEALSASRAKRLQREGTLLAIGYRLLNRGHTEASLSVFRIATERHPKSANAWESYSEALERAGRNDDALKQARRALKLEPAPEVKKAAEERIARLGRG